MAACLTQNVSAQNWTGLGTDNLWSDAANWDTGVPGTTTPNGVSIGSNAGGSESTLVTITNGEVENVGTVGGNQSIFGPQWGSKLNIYGTLNWGFIIFPVQWDATAGNQSVINLFNGSSFASTVAGNTLLLGDAWWYAAPYVTMNLYGNASANYQYLAWGGHLNIYDNATNTISTAVLEGGTQGFWGQAGPSDATRQMDLVGGTLILPTAFGPNVTNWISRGIFLVYGKAQDMTDFTLTDDGTNTVVKPTPLGALQNISLQSPRSTMMVGTFQNPVALGNFANVSGVPLSALDAAQLGGATVVYSSSATNVVGVTASGHVTALHPGTTTVSATLGAFTSTNSVLITVTPFTNSLIHRYSFSETSGTTTADSVGGSAWAGTLNGGASLGGGEVALDGSSGYVQLPAGVVSGFDAVTVEAWVNLNNPQQAWAPLYAFGDTDTSAFPNVGENYIALQPYTGFAVPTCATTFGTGSPGNADEQDASFSLVSGVVTNVLLGYWHITAVYQPYAGYVAVYTNGVLAAINNRVSNPLAATLGADPLNYLGHSLYPADPYLNASIDEFRVYSSPLTAGQITAAQVLGPNQVLGTSMNVSLSAAVSGGNLTLKWPTTSALVTLSSSSTLGSAAVWTPVTAPLTEVGSNYQITVPVTSGQLFFRLQQ